MKKYIKPELNCIEIRAEERLAAACVDPGSCVSNGAPSSFSMS